MRGFSFLAALLLLLPSLIHAKRLLKLGQLALLKEINTLFLFDLPLKSSISSLSSTIASHLSSTETDIDDPRIPSSSSVLWPILVFHPPYNYHNRA